MSRTVRKRVRKHDKTYWEHDWCWGEAPKKPRFDQKEFNKLNSDKYSSRWSVKSQPMKEELHSKVRAREKHVIANILKDEDYETDLLFETRGIRGIRWSYD